VAGDTTATIDGAYRDPDPQAPKGAMRWNPELAATNNRLEGPAETKEET
jgi:hypothetical protein